MVLTLLRRGVRTMRPMAVPELVLSRSRAIANARAAVDRNRLAAAERAVAEDSGEWTAVLVILAGAAIRERGLLGEGTA